MSDRVRMIEKLREELSEIPKGASVDPIAIANSLAERFSVPIEEIHALVKSEARARGIPTLEPKGK